MVEIELGDKVKCIHTGFEGIAVARTKFINGCIQYSVAQKHKKGAECIEDMGIDAGSLKVIESRHLEQKPLIKKTVKTKKPLGGKSRIGMKFRGF